MARRLGIVTAALLLCVVALVNDTYSATAAQPKVRGVWRQLAGPAEGTQAATFDSKCPLAGDPAVHLRHDFDVGVAGGPAVGTIQVAVDMCVSFVEGVSSYDGTFVLRTRLGNTSGRASGSVTEVIPPDVRTVFILTPSSGTGALKKHLVPLRWNSSSTFQVSLWSRQPTAR